MVQITVVRDPRNYGYNLKHNQPEGWQGIIGKTWAWYKFKSDAERQAKALEKSYNSKMLWDQLRDIPVNDNMETEEEFLHFPIGTDCQEIWHWFEEEFDLSVAKDLMRL